MNVSFTCLRAEIIVGIENLFGVDISGAGATKEDFRSIETLTAFVEAHKEG